MWRLIEDAGLRERLGKAGREWVRGHLSHERLVEKTEGFYGELLGMTKFE